MEENRRFRTVVSLSHHLWVSLYQNMNWFNKSRSPIKSKFTRNNSVIFYIVWSCYCLTCFFDLSYCNFFSGEVFYENRWRHLLEYSHAHPVPTQRRTKITSNSWLREERTPGISPAYICIRSKLHFRPSTLHCWSWIHYIRRYYSGFRTNSK